MLGLGCILCWASTISWILGIYTMLNAVISVGFYVYKTYIRKPKDLKATYGQGSWVVITGPTAGIGEEFARQFSKNGFNLVLIGRSKEKLEETEKMLKEENPSKQFQIKSIQADLSQSIEPKFYEDIYKQVENLDISILVNNAGKG